MGSAGAKRLIFFHAKFNHLHGLLRSIKITWYQSGLFHLLASKHLDTSCSGVVRQRLQSKTSLHGTSSQALAKERMLITTCLCEKDLEFARCKVTFPCATTISDASLRNLERAIR